MSFELKFLLVVMSVAFGDMCWVKYMLYVNEKKAFKSAVWGTLILLCAMFVVVQYVGDKRLMVAACIGAFLGTYFTVKFSK